MASEQPSIVRILEVTGMDQVLDLHATPGEALAAVARDAEAKG